MPLNTPIGKVWSGFRSLIDSIDDRAYFSWTVRHRKRLKAFHDKHAGESCFILGNGPSLGRMDLRPLRDVRTIGLNKIFLHPQVEQIGLDYHVAVNPLVIDQGFNKFKNMKGSSFLSFEPCYQRNLIHRDFFYIFTGGTHRFSFHPFDRIAEGCTVTFVALQLAYFMGFTTVYLIGVDHSFKTTGEPHEKQLLEGDDINHFHPDYFRGCEWQLPDLWGSELAYELARYFFHKDDRQILDATVDGKLEIFQKIGFEEALASCLTERRNRVAK